MLDKLEILGLRGFATQQTIKFAESDGRRGSGLTVLVGPNNAGKSTVIEALRALAQRDIPSFTQGRRNRQAGDRIYLRLTDNAGGETILRSIVPGSSETERVSNSRNVDVSKLLVLPSRRTFNPYFNHNTTTRDNYMANIGFPAIRTSAVNQFTLRLFEIQKNRSTFDDVLAKVLDPVPNWTIDQMDNGEYFLKFINNDVSHSSEGLGEGIISLFFLIDSLYDSKPGNIIAIDEPELSLHPLLQRKLSTLLTDYSSDRQIILSTHSPYFVNLDALQNGASVLRVYLQNGQSLVSQMKTETAQRIAGLLRNYNNPHILGINAQEVFFLEDKIILVEGQEDVIYYHQVQKLLDKYLNGTFFGWGVGGADNMEIVADILSDLGFSHVVGILDGNRSGLIEKLAHRFPRYHFFAIPADDVRTKCETPSKPSVIGLLDDKSQSIRPEFIERLNTLFIEANVFLSLDKISQV